MMEPEIILLDNGSLQPASVRRLRVIAGAVSNCCGRQVNAVSLLHSDRVDPEKIHGIPAKILENFILEKLGEGKRRFLIIPFFLGPSAALNDYIPERLAILQKEQGAIDFEMTPCLVDLENDHEAPAVRHPLSAMIFDQISELLAGRHFQEKPHVVVVDHGSPQPPVTAVRDFITGQAGQQLGNSVKQVIAASMERRPEDQYEFNEPLLARALSQEFIPGGEVILAHLFLLPGRHAGEGGDIDQICQAAMNTNPDLQIHRTKLLGEHPGMVDYLSHKIESVFV